MIDDTGYAEVFKSPTMMGKRYPELPIKSLRIRFSVHEDGSQFTYRGVTFCRTVRFEKANMATVKHVIDTTVIPRSGTAPDPNYMVFPDERFLTRGYNGCKVVTDRFGKVEVYTSATTLAKVLGTYPQIVRGHLNTRMFGGLYIRKAILFKSQHDMEYPKKITLGPAPWVRRNNI